MDEIKEIISSLWLSEDLHWDLTLYWIILVNAAMLFMLPDGTEAFWALLCILVITAAVIDKTYAFGYMFDSGRYEPQEYHREIFIGTYLIRALMFVGPFALAGSTDSGKVRAAGIAAGVTGAVYMFARWFMEQREVGGTDIGLFMDYDILPQTAGMALILAKLTLGRRLHLGRVHRVIPVPVLREPAAHEVEV